MNRRSLLSGLIAVGCLAASPLVASAADALGAKEPPH